MKLSWMAEKRLFGKGDRWFAVVRATAVVDVACDVVDCR